MVHEFKNVHGYEKQIMNFEENFMDLGKFDEFQTS